MRFDSWEGAVQRDEVPNKLPGDVVRQLSVLRPCLTLSAVVGDWILIVATIWLCEAAFHPVLFVLACAFIGARQHGLEIMMHEAVHYRFHPNRAVNDWLSDITSAWPTAITTNFYRRARHFDHHRNIGYIDDPHIAQSYRDSEEWEFPTRGRDLVSILFRDMVRGPISVWNGLVQSSKHFSSRGQLVMRGLFYAIALSLIVWCELGKEFVAYWLIPLCVWTPVLHRFRLIAEHFGIADTCERRGVLTRSTVARSVVLRWFDKAFLVPHNLNYHVEHHYYPSVPFYNLPRLHKQLVSVFRRVDTPAFYVSDGYITVWRELTRRTVARSR